MSRVSTSYPSQRHTAGAGQLAMSSSSRSSSSMSTKSNLGNGSSVAVVSGSGGNSSGHVVTVRSAAPPPVQKETVHACTVCNGEYKDPRVLPCTHTFCLNCIQDHLVNNNQITCPKCKQAYVFDEIDLNELPRNIILSQGWRASAQPVPSVPIPKKPVTYQTTTSTPAQMSNQQDKRKSSVTEVHSQDSPKHGAISQGLSSIANTFSRLSGNKRSSRSPSVGSIHSVSNLVRIYTEATVPSEPSKSRSDSVASRGKSDELIRIFEQATNRPQLQQSEQRVPSSASIIKRSSQALEEGYEEMTWDNLVHGTIPAAPPMPDQLHRATEDYHRPAITPERSLSVASSQHQSNVDHLVDIIASMNQHTNEKASPLRSQGPTNGAPSQSRASTASRSQHDFDDDEDDDDSIENQMFSQPPVYAMIPSRESAENIRPSSIHDSVRSNASSSTIRPSVVPAAVNSSQPKSSSASSLRPSQQQAQQPDRAYDRTPSIRSSATRSPSQTIQKLNFGSGGGVPVNPRSASATSIRSLASDDANERLAAIETTESLTERFKTSIEVPPLVQNNSSPHVRKQVNNDFSTPPNRSLSKSTDRDTRYRTPVLTPAPATAATTTTTTTTTAAAATTTITTISLASRIDSLISEQKRLEHEIDEQVRRLNYDYDEICRQLHKKESSTDHEINGTVPNLDDSSAQHFYQQQKIYADLAADTNAIGSELESLKLRTNSSNKQQLWDNLEKIEAHIQNIRQAVEHQMQLHNAITFAEGHKSITAATVGQVTNTHGESRRRFDPSQSPMYLPSSHIEQTSTNIAPYKYLKMDHLSTLEPESIALTESNQKILLGICNKLFVLNEHGDTLKTIPLTPSIRGITVSKKYQSQNIAYISHDETVSVIDIDNGQTLDCVKEVDSTGQAGVFLPLGIDTDNIRGDVYVCDYRNSCVIKFDEKLEFITQWKVYNHSHQYEEARPKLVSVYEQRLFMIVEHSSKPFYNQGIAYTFSLHICDINSGNIIRIVDAELLGPQRLRWPCAVHAISNEKCYILDTMTSGKYFNGQWQKHWSRVLEIGQDDHNVINELFQLDSEAVTMAMTKQLMIIAANGDILFVDLGFISNKQQQIEYGHSYQNMP